MLRGVQSRLSQMVFHVLSSFVLPPAMIKATRTMVGTIITLALRCSAYDMGEDAPGIDDPLFAATLLNVPCSKLLVEGVP
ncbi:hypothetical protein BJF89_17580 [Corynebacterium sp. CNJ-954]|nr:hypothetical protein BJF89_17580 [Corynebacterium sp. CNJ-954]